MTENMGRLLVVGGGRMGEALAAGLLSSGWAAERVVIVEADPDRRAALRTGTPVVGSIDEATQQAPEAQTRLAGTSGETPTSDDQHLGAVIAVKPHDVHAVCTALRAARPARVLSIAAGVTLADLDAWLAPAAAIRAMPNTPALVGSAASAVAAGRNATPVDVSWAKAVLGAIGTVVELPEPALDAVTGLSGSGPAYVFLIAEALIDAGVLAGLARTVARDLVVQTLLGSARLLAETGQEPAELRAAVTSPGGTTAAGLRALEDRAVRAAILEAVIAATARARQLGAPSAEV